MARMVLLEHTTPDGGAHFDWLLARRDVVGEDERALVAFRVETRSDVRSGGAMEAARLADHRGRYLRFEGDIGGGRGVVRRVAEGECSITLEGPGVVEATVRWARGEWLSLRASMVCGRPGGDAWLLEIGPVGPMC